MKMPRRSMALPCNFASQPLGKLIRLERGKWCWKATRSDHQTSSMNFPASKLKSPTLCRGTWGTWKKVHDKYECMNPVLTKRSQPIPPQHSLKNCQVLVWFQVALEKIRKKNREDFLNGTKEEDFQSFCAKSISLAKISLRLATGRWDHQHILTLVNLRTRCLMSFPLNGSMPGWILPKPSQAFVFLSDVFPVGNTPRHQIPGQAHPYLGRSLAIFTSGFFLCWVILYIYIWFLGQPRLSLHAFFFLLCRWKAVFGDGFGEG